MPRLAKLATIVAAVSVTVGMGAQLVPHASGQCGPTRYAIYEDENYGGHGRLMCVNQPDLSHEAYGSLPWQNFNNMITSLKNNFAATDTPVYFYDDANYVNYLKSWLAGTVSANVGQTYNDRFGSAYNLHN